MKINNKKITQENKRLLMENQQYQKEIERYEQMIADNELVVNSTLWKSTYPLRKFLDIFKSKASNVNNDNKDVFIEEKKNITKSNLNELLLQNIKTNKVAFIFQYSYFTFDGTRYISGGGERYATDLSKILKKIGYEVVLIQKGNSNHCWTNEYDGLYVIGVANSDNDYIDEISNIEIKSNINIYSGCVYWGEKIRDNSVLISHGITWDCPSSNANTFAILNIIKKFNILVSVDNNTLSWIRSTYSKDIGKMKIDLICIPNYCITNQYYSKTKNNKIDILFPRRCCDERGFWLLSDTLEEIMDKHKNVNMSFVGFIHEDSIKERIDYLKTKYKNRIKHSFVNANEMHKIYGSSDITVIPTLYSEGTSLSCIEAMAAGNAIISTNIGGLSNLIIDGYNGLLINPNAIELKDSLEMLIVDEKLRNKLSNNSKRVAKCFDKKIWNRKWLEVIERF